MAVIFRSIRICILVSIILFGAMSICIAQEDITPRHREQLKELAAETRRKTMHERDDLRHARMSLYQVYKSYNIDESKAKTALSKINSAQLNLLNLHFQNQIELRKIIDEGQFNAFKERMQRFRSHGMGVMSPHKEQFIEILPDRKMLKNAGLNQEQLRKASNVLKEKRKETEVIGKLRRDSIKLMGLYSKYDLDTQAAKRLMQSIHDSQSDLADLNHRKQQAFRKILTEPQFVQVRDQVINKMNKNSHRQGSQRK